MAEDTLHLRERRGGEEEEEKYLFLETGNLNLNKMFCFIFNQGC